MSEIRPHTVLVINPGSTSTRVALFTPVNMLWQKDLRHQPNDLAPVIMDQLNMRLETIEPLLPDIPDGSLAAVAGRGGGLKPQPGGTYLVNEAMIGELSSARYAEHASNLGAMLAQKIADRYGVPAYIVDPVTTDEFEPASRISGVPEIVRRCRSHALNIKAVARKVVDERGLSWPDSNFVVAHMGGGISVAALRGGKIVDVNDALLGMGPFSPERAGALPLEGLLDLAFSGKYNRSQLKHKLSRESGLMGYLDTNDLTAVFEKVDAGSKIALDVYSAMLQQIAKEIGAMATVLNGNLDGIILTGGMAHSHRLCADIEAKVRFVAQISIIAGSLEMEALAQGAWRVISKQETAKEYV